MSTTTHAPKGLEGVVATTSGICFIDGERGVLAYRGIDIHELADHSTFEETCYLLWFGKLPTRRELGELHERLAEERKLLDAVVAAAGFALKNERLSAELRARVSELGASRARILEAGDKERLDRLRNTDLDRTRCRLPAVTNPDDAALFD